MKLNEIAVGMIVVCKKSHAGDHEHYWVTPEMDVAVGKPMTVINLFNDGLVCCESDQRVKFDDGRWCYLPKWLEPWQKEDEDVREKN